MESRPKVAVVVVCLNSADSLPALLSALEVQLGQHDELVLVDNASSDDTAHIARTAAPAATVLETGSNLGFAGGCVAGANACRAPLLVFLNPDTVPLEGAIDALSELGNEKPSWGAWQGLVMLPDRERVNTSGNIVHYVGIGWAGGLGSHIDSVETSPHEIGFASGAAMVVRRSAWDSVGGFDPDFFMYSEDLDLSLRLKLAGWGVGIEPRARFTHDYEFEKATTSGTTSSAIAGGRSSRCIRRHCWSSWPRHYSRANWR